MSASSAQLAPRGNMETDFSLAVNIQNLYDAGVIAGDSPFGWSGFLVLVVGNFGA